MTNDVVIATDNDILIIPGFLFQHLTLCNFESASYLLYHLFVFSA